MDFKDTIINIQKILCDLRTRIDNITNTPVTVTTGRGENYTYLDLTSSDTAANTITLQTEINRVSNLTPYGLPLSDTNRFTIYATGKVNSISVYPFTNLCSPAGFLEFNNLSSGSNFESQDFINIKVTNTVYADLSQKLTIKNSYFNAVFSASISEDLTLLDTTFNSKCTVNNNWNLQINNCSVRDTCNITNAYNLQISNSFITSINVSGNPTGLIYNSILNPAEIVLPLKLRGCLDLNNDPINDNEFYKNIYSDTTLDNSHNNSIIFVKNSVTITLSVNLAIDFNCIVKCLSGCTATYIAGVGATISTESTGVLQLERTPSSITKDGINNYVLTGTT